MGQNPNAYTDFHLFCELNHERKEEVLVCQSKPRKQGKSTQLKMIEEREAERPTASTEILNHYAHSRNHPFMRSKSFAVPLLVSFPCISMLALLSIAQINSFLQKFSQSKVLTIQLAHTVIQTSHNHGNQPEKILRIFKMANCNLCSSRTLAGCKCF